MPEIPTFEAQDDTHLVNAPRADVGAFMAPGEALARAGESFGATEQQFEAKLLEQHRMMTISNTLAQTSPALGNLEHKWSLVPDRQQAIAGFNQDAVALHKQYIDGIADPEVKAVLTDRFNQEAIAYQHSTGEKAFDLESSKHRGDTDAALNNLAIQAASAPNPHTLAIISDNAAGVIKANVAGGWESPQQGADRTIGWHSKMQEVQARNAFNAAFNNSDPQAMDTLTKRLSDPTQFPGLDKETEESLLRQAILWRDRLENHQLIQEQRADITAERSMRMAQTANESKLLGVVLSGQPFDRAQIPQLLEHQQISSAGADALLGAATRAEDGHDDPLIAAHLWDAIGNGRATTNDVYGLFTAGKLSKPTMIDAVKAIDAKANKDNPADKANYAVLKTALSGAAIESGNLFGDKSSATANWAQAQGEWNRRVTIGGEDSGAVLSDMIPRYASAFLKPTWLAPTKYGTPASTRDVMAAAGRLAAAYKSKQISPGDFQAQAELLTDYRRYYALEDQRNAARARVSPRGKAGSNNSGGGASLVGMTPGGSE